MKHVSTHLKLLAVAVIWGLGWVAGRVAALEIPPFTAGWVRYIIAVSCFLMFLKITNQWIIPSRDQWKIITAIGFLSTFLYQAFFMYGMKWTAAGDASLMITFNPLFTAILAVPFLGEKFDKRLGLGLLSAVCGVAVIAWYSPNVDLPVNERLLGDALIAMSALSWACTTILMKKAMSDDRSKHTILPLSKFCLMQITRQRVRQELKMTKEDAELDQEGTEAADKIEKKIEYLFVKQNEKKDDIKIDNSSFLKAITTVILADITMSLDNVLGVAGAARDHYYLLVFGLALSIALMATAATLISEWIKKYKWIAWVGLLAVLIVCLLYTSPSPRD